MRDDFKSYKSLVALKRHTKSTLSAKDKLLLGPGKFRESYLKGKHLDTPERKLQAAMKSEAAAVSAIKILTGYVSDNSTIATEI